MDGWTIAGYCVLIGYNVLLQIVIIEEKRKRKKMIALLKEWEIKINNTQWVQELDLARRKAELDGVLLRAAWEREDKLQKKIETLQRIFVAPAGAFDEGGEQQT